MFDKKDKIDRLPDLSPSKHSFGAFPVPQHQDDFEEEDAFSKQAEEEDEKHALPAFPNSPSHNSFSQAAIKDAVRGDVEPEVSEEHLPDLPELPGEKHKEEEKAKIVEMEEWQPEHPLGVSRIEPPEEEYPRPVEVRDEIENVKFTKREVGTPDVFVKIDKFRSARKTFHDIRKKLDDIDDLIVKIRETKLREEQELAAWEKDVTQIKARVQDVSENMFDKV